MVTTYPAMGVPPYAAPIAASVMSSGSASAARYAHGPGTRIGPYVPARQRGGGRSTAASFSVSMPTPPASVSTRMHPLATIVSGAEMDAALFGEPETAALPSIDDFLDSPVESGDAPWVLQSAVRDLAALSRTMTVDPRERRAKAVPVSESLPEWGENDFAELEGHRAAAVQAGPLVARPSSFEGDAGSPSLARATHNAEAAALALELLALRVRAGELVLPGYDPKTGDAGALVVALAALLGIRLEHPGSP